MIFTETTRDEAGQQIADKLQPLFAFIKVSRACLGSDRLFINISLDSPHTWEYKIYQNSNNMLFSIYANGTLELCNKSLRNNKGEFVSSKLKFRKQKAKSIEDLCQRIIKYYNQASLIVLGECA